MVRLVLGKDQRTFQQAYQNTLPNKFLVNQARIRKNAGPCTWMMVSLTPLSPFCSTNTNIVRDSKSTEDREIGRRFATLWVALAAKLHDIFHERNSKVLFIVPALDARSQILSILDRKNGVVKLVFKLAPSSHEHLCDLNAF